MAGKRNDVSWGLAEQAGTRGAMLLAEGRTVLKKSVTSSPMLGRTAAVAGAWGCAAVHIFVQSFGRNRVMGEKRTQL